MDGTLSVEERSILKTIVYFDLFSYPLTPLEAWKWLMTDGASAHPTLGHVTSLLETSTSLRSLLDHAEGFYFLRGRDDIVAVRKQRYLLAERKYNQVLRAVHVLRIVPCIKLIAVCNSLAYSNARDSSDLDLFVITQPGKIWTVRQLMTGLAALLGWRPTADKARDQICLSFFVSEEGMNLHPMTLDPGDVYLRYWIDQLVPVWGDPAALDAFRSENGWQKEFLPNAYGVETAQRRRREDGRSARFVRGLLGAVHAGRIGNALESRYRAFQLRHLPERLRALVNTDTRVVMNDRMLKFHDNDRRRQFAEQYEANLQNILA